jgi:hypothetical protein
VDKAPLLEIPIRSVNLSDPADKARQDKMVSLVEQMIELSRQERAAKSESTRTRIRQAINVSQEQIDSLVYELYGLTDEEIKIVEGTA